ncbi:MAG: anti-sigma factor domain-containing protein [Acidimicrobiales bacterium]
MTEGTDAADDRGSGAAGEDTLEAEALERVVGMLRHADPDEVEAWAEPPADLEDRIVERIRAEDNGRVADLGERRTERERRMSKLLVAAAAAVVAAVLAVGAFSLIGGDQPGPGSSSDEVAGPAEPAEPEVDPIELAGMVPGAAGSVALVQGAEATELRLVASGLEPDQVYAAWLAPAEGERVPAGTFRTDEDGEIQADLVSSFPLASAARVWVTDPADTTVLRAPLT